MTSLSVNSAPPTDCWNRIGVRGDQSCPELSRVVHCHNCPVFENAGRRFLEGPSPEAYLDEWTRRLAASPEEETGEQLGVLVFRLGEEWLALTVQVLVEVTTPRPSHRIPHRGGVLAGLVNIRGELHLSVHLDELLGLGRNRDDKPLSRLLVVESNGDRWVFPVDEVDQVRRLALNDQTPVPATVGRSLARLSRGVVHLGGRSIGLLDDERLFRALKERLK